MTDYIEILNEDGSEETYELVSTFNLRGFPSNYVIYKEMNEAKYYVAKYNGTSMSDLNTNLSVEEMKLCQNVFEEVVGNEA